MTRLVSDRKPPHPFRFVLVVAIVVSAAVPVHAFSSGGPGGKWPKSWPRELEPLRKQAWTWMGGLVGIISYHVPFSNRKEFEAAWPHILKLNSKGVAITLVRGPRVNAWKVFPKKKNKTGVRGKSAGVIIRMPLKNTKAGPYSKIAITLVVDGNTVDLNRIRLPANTPITDRRFENRRKKVVAKKAPATNKSARPAAADRGPKGK